VLARRPVHRSPTQHMQMQMIHGLPAIGTAVDHHAKAARRMLLADLSRTMQQMPKHRIIRRLHMSQRRNLALGNDEDVHRRNRRNIMERKTQLVLKDFFARNFAGQDAAEDRVCHA